MWWGKRDGDGGMVGLGLGNCDWGVTMGQFEPWGGEITALITSGAWARVGYRRLPLVVGWGIIVGARGVVHKSCNMASCVRVLPRAWRGGSVGCRTVVLKLQGTPHSHHQVVHSSGRVTLWVGC